MTTTPLKKDLKNLLITSKNLSMTTIELRQPPRTTTQLLRPSYDDHPTKAEFPQFVDQSEKNLFTTTIELRRPLSYDDHPGRPSSYGDHLTEKKFPKFVKQSEKACLRRPLSYDDHPGQPPSDEDLVMTTTLLKKNPNKRVYDDHLTKN